MIHYHGLPITPETAAVAAVSGGHAFVSFAHLGQTRLAIECCQSFAVDNGAFSAWMSGKPISDWAPFFEWAEELSYLPNCDFIVIPDVIDGDLNDQTVLISKFMRHFGSRGLSIGAPVFHMHEPLEHAKYLSTAWSRVCIGSSGEYAKVGTESWWERMYDILRAMCDEKGRPRCKIHGLRMLNPLVFTKLPLSSADSTNIGRNIGIDKAWKGTYLPPNKSARAALLRSRIESHNAATHFDDPSIPSWLKYA